MATSSPASGFGMRVGRLRSAVALGLLFGVSGPAHAADPAWWHTGTASFIDAGAADTTADNYDVINVGQLKNVAAQAKKYLDPLLPNNASRTAVVNKLAEFAPANGSTYTTAELQANYAPANVGQLKAIAAPFYDWLASGGCDIRQNLVDHGYPAGWTYNYPWDNTAAPADNYALANLGQLKVVFAFDLTTPPAAISQTVSVDENTSVAVTLSAAPVILHNFTFTEDAPAHGTLTGTAPNVTYYPLAHYSGTDSFTFHVVKAGTVVSTGTITLAVNHVNQPPQVDASPNVVTVTANGAGIATLTLTGKVSDVDLPADTINTTWSLDSTPAAPGSVSFGTPTATTSTTTYPASTHAFQPGTTVTFPLVGTYHLRLSAFDGGAMRSDNVTVEVLPQTHATAPTVTLTASPSPVALSSPVTLVASVTGTMTGGVDFYEGSRLIGSATTATSAGLPATYQIDWAASYPGLHLLSARVANSTGVAYSASVPVTVRSDIGIAASGQAMAGNNGDPDNGGDGGSAPNSSNSNNRGENGNSSDPGGDDDNDGLSNAEETKIGTDLSNPDTDGDGVVDGTDGWAGGTNPTEEKKFSPPRLPDPHYVVIDIVKEDDRKNSPLMDQPLLSDSGDVVYGYAGKITIPATDTTDNPTGADKIVDGYSLYCWQAGTATQIQDRNNTALSLAERTFYPAAINVHDALAGSSLAFQAYERVEGYPIPSQRAGASPYGLTEMSMSKVVWPTAPVAAWEETLATGSLSAINDDGYTVGTVNMFVSSGLTEDGGHAGMTWDNDGVGTLLLNGFFHYRSPMGMPYETYTTTDSFEPKAIAPDAGHEILGVKSGHQTDGDGYSTPINVEAELVSPSVVPFLSGSSNGGFNQTGDVYVSNATESDIWLKQGTSYNQVKITDKQKQPVLLSSLDAKYQALSGNNLWQNYGSISLADTLKDEVTVNGKQLWQNFQFHAKNNSGVIVAIVDKDENGDGKIDLGAAPDYNGPDKRHLAAVVSVDITIKKQGEAVSPEGVLVKKGDTIEISLSPDYMGKTKRFADIIKWYSAQLKGDGSYEDYAAIGTDATGSYFKFTTTKAGIFKIAAVVNDDQSFEYLRKKDDLYGKDSDGVSNTEEYKIGKPDRIGIVDDQWQIDVCKKARAYLGSTKYAKAANLPRGTAQHSTAGMVKCNLFVGDVLFEANVAVPYKEGSDGTLWPPTTRAWYDKTNLPNWTNLGESTNPQPGYVVVRPGWTYDITNGVFSIDYTFDGHCGILDYDGAWINAGSKTVNRYPNLHPFWTNDYQPTHFQKLSQ